MKIQNTDNLTSHLLAFSHNTFNLKPTAESPRLKTQMRDIQMSDAMGSGAEISILFAVFKNTAAVQVIIKQ